MKEIIEEQTFKGIVFTKESFKKAEYDNCIFENCDFSAIEYLTNIDFIDCVFDYCNLSLVKVKSTTFKKVSFKNCKLLGINFGDCNPFLLHFSFHDCQLNLASFYQLKLKGMLFKNCHLHEVDFTETDLSGAIFDNCDLTNAIFDHTILEKTNFSKAFNFSIDPENNRLKKAKFSATNIKGLLEKYQLEIVA